MPDTSDEGAVIVPAPLTRVQIPAPTEGALPDKVAALEHSVWSAPASAIVVAAIGSEIVSVFVPGQLILSTTFKV